MFCIHCGKEIPDNAEFCSYCGKKLVITSEQRQTESHNSSYQQLGGEYRQQRSDYVNKATDLFDSLQNKVQEKIGVNDSRQITHEFQKLGGFLAVLTYGWLVTGIYFVWCIIKALFSMIATNAVTGGLISMLTGPILLIVAVVYGLGAFLCIRMFLLIQRKDTGFLYYYEIVGIISLAAIIVLYIIIAIYLRSSLGAYSSYVMPTLWASLIPSLLILGVCFALMLRYFGKSVRVRTYFGTDEYLKRSIFLKNTVFPIPAVSDRI